MKTLISLLTSFQLLFLQVVIPIATTSSIFSSPQAFADEETEETGTAEDQYNENAADEAAAGDAIAGAAGDAASGVMGLFKGADVGSSADIMNFVMLLLIGFITASLFACTEYSADIILAAIGGVIYIGAEIMQLFESEAKYEQEAINYKTTTTGAPDLDEKQSDAFTSQREGYLEAKQAAEKKANLQKAASTSWYAAAAVAMAFWLAEDMAATMCVTMGTIEAAKIPPNPACGYAVTKSAIIATKAKIPGVSTADAAFRKAAAGSIVACASCGMLSGAILNSTAACTTGIMITADADIDLLEILNPSYNLNKPKIRMSMEANEQFIGSDVLMEIIEKTTNLVFPVAKAANPLVTLFGGFGGGIAIFMMFKKSLAGVIDTMIGTPFKRSIVFAILGALGNMTSKKQMKVADKMQDNVDKINGILQRFQNISQANQIINNSFNQGGDITSIPLRTSTRIGTDEKPFPCLSMNKKKKCVSSKSILDNKIAQSGIDLPSGLTSLSSLAGTTADGFAGRSNLSKGTVDGINNLSKSLSSTKRLNDRLRKKANDQLKKSKRKPINFAKLENNFLKKMQGSLLKTMKKQNLNAPQLLSAISPGTNTSSFGSGDVKDKIKKALVKTNDSKVAVQGGSKSNRRGAGGFQFKLDDEADELETDALTAGDEGLEGLEGELEVDDIVQDPSVSIFKVISVRYLKSGYPRVLEKKDK